MVGLVRGVHGLNGALRVEVLTDSPEERFARGGRLYREGSSEPLRVVDAVAIPDGPGWRIRLAEVPDRSTAEAFRGAYLEADMPAAAQPAQGAYYWHEIIGVPVSGLDGEELGTVVDIYRVGENDAYVVRGGPRGEFDIPAVRGFIQVFEPREGRIVVDVDALELGPAKPARAPRPPRPRRGELRPARPREAQESGEAAAEPGAAPGPETAPAAEDAPTAGDAGAPAAVADLPAGQ